jgi:CBS domain-containing protein
MTSPKQRPVDVTDRPVVGLMSQPVFAIPADASLDDALRALLIAGLRHLVVVDAAGRFVGVLDDRQVAAEWAHDPGSLATATVDAVLDACPPIVTRTATLRTVARVMRNYQTDIVVVVDPGRVAVGVVTAGDVVAAVAELERAPAVAAAA